MKPLLTKAQVRAELEAQMQQYLQEGGAVADIPRGISGYLDNHNPYAHQGESPPRQERTSLQEVVKVLEARKQQKHGGFKPRPKKKLIKDDFGEPLRWVWTEE